MGLLEGIASVRNPVRYGRDVLVGLHHAGPRGTRRMLLRQIGLSSGLGVSVTAVGAGGVALTRVAAPAAVHLQSLLTPQVGESVILALALSAVAGLLQGTHRLSAEGQAVRAVRAQRAAARAVRRKAPPQKPQTSQKQPKRAGREQHAQRSRWLL
jgi:hypothetical protein